MMTVHDRETPQNKTLSVEETSTQKQVKSLSEMQIQVEPQEMLETRPFWIQQTAVAFDTETLNK